jgi:radical SAM superfamily enzyme YgiQ (UPF0313 family)
MRPPVSPVGLDYLAAALDDAGFPVELIDLAFEADPMAALANRLARTHPLLVGVSIRNLDDAHGLSRRSSLPGHRRIVHDIRRHCPAPMVLGGAGFSIMPQAVLDFCGAKLGIIGSGERALVALARRVRAGESAEGIPGVILRRPDSRCITLPVPVSLDGLPLHRRRWLDNRRYWREGGQVGFETKRGCAHRCSYCVEAGSARGGVQLRRPESVVEELRCLLSQGCCDLHTCDSEFNHPPDHAAAVCQAIRAAGLDGQLRWYAYCTPAGFTADLAADMAAAGCAGINFGVDHTDPALLRRLKRGFTPEEAVSALRAAKAAGLAVMADLLLGSPGETPRTLRRAIEDVKRLDLDAVGVGLGVRIYPGTELARELRLRPARLVAPTFYLDPAVGSMRDALEQATRWVAGDRRFLLGAGPGEPNNSNYNDNQALIDAIAAGARGAYWHILAKLRGEAAGRSQPTSWDG